jgi:hypothetical protein
MLTPFFRWCEYCSNSLTIDLNQIHFGCGSVGYDGWSRRSLPGRAVPGAPWGTEAVLETTRCGPATRKVFPPSLPGAERRSYHQRLLTHRAFCAPKFASDLSRWCLLLRQLARLPGDVDFPVGASLPISGLTAWQGLFQHGRLQAGQSVLAHGAAGAVGSMVTQLAREAGGYVIGTGRAADRQKALDFGAQEFVDLDNDALEDVGGVDLVFDVIGGDIQKRSAGLIRAGGTLVSIVGPTEARPADGLAVDFVVESPIVPN